MHLFIFIISNLLLALLLLSQFELPPEDPWDTPVDLADPTDPDRPTSTDLVAPSRSPSRSVSPRVAPSRSTELLRATKVD